MSGVSYNVQQCDQSLGVKSLKILAKMKSIKLNVSKNESLLLKKGDSDKINFFMVYNLLQK